MEKAKNDNKKFGIAIKEQLKYVINLWQYPVIKLFFFVFKN